MNPQPVSLADELRKLAVEIEREGCSCDVMHGYACGIHAKLAKLPALLAQHAVAEPQQSAEITPAEFSFCMEGYDSGAVRRETVLQRLNDRLKFPAHAAEQPKLTALRAVLKKWDSFHGYTAGQLVSDIRALLTSPVAPPPQEEDYSICGYRTERWIEGTDHSFVCKRRPGHSGQHYSNAQTGDELGLSGGGTSKADAKDGADTGSCRQQSVDSPVPPVAPGEQPPPFPPKITVSTGAPPGCTAQALEQMGKWIELGTLPAQERASDDNCEFHEGRPLVFCGLCAKEMTEPLQKALANGELVLKEDVATAAKQAREEALEEAAKICDSVGPTKWITGCDAFELSKAIRALATVKRFP